MWVREVEQCGNGSGIGKLGPGNGWIQCQWWLLNPTPLLGPDPSMWVHTVLYLANTAKLDTPPMPQRLLLAKRKIEIATTAPQQETVGTTALAVLSG